MKSTKNVRTQTVAAAKTRNKKAGTVDKTSVPSKKSGDKVTVSKTLSSPSRLRPTKKTGKAEQVTKTMKSSPNTKVSAKTRKSIVQKVKDKRKNHQLTGAEYDAFVVKTARKEQVTPEELVTVDRRQAKLAVAEKPDTKHTTKFNRNQERRQKIQRRRQIDPTTCERDYSQEEIEFMNALDEYKRNSGRMFPTCSEILEVFRGLGYMKQACQEKSTSPELSDVYVAVTEIGTMLHNDDRHDEEHTEEFSRKELTFF